MSYSLEQFCTDTRAVLAGDKTSAGREKIRLLLEKLVVDKDFQATYMTDEALEGLKQLHEDTEQEFCVLAYNMTSPRKSPPHDHGKSWAIYGQVEAYTDVTDWERNNAGEGDDGVKAARVYRLDPGHAGLYDVGDIHSIDYPSGSKFVRVTGRDMAKETRLVFDPDNNSVKTVEHVGTGNP